MKFVSPFLFSFLFAITSFAQRDTSIASRTEYLEKKGQRVCYSRSERFNHADSVYIKLKRELDSIKADHRKRTAEGCSRPVKSQAKPPVDTNGTASFESLKGKMSLPVQHFDSVFANMYLEFHCSKSTTIHAVAGGLVTKVVQDPSQTGFFIIVRHGKYLSVYRCVDSVCVKGNQKILAGEKIGVTSFQKTGETFSVQIWKQSEKQNSAEWIDLSLITGKRCKRIAVGCLGF